MSLKSIKKNKQKNVSFIENGVSFEEEEVASFDAADNCFFEGRLNDAAQYYSELMKINYNKITMSDTILDSNNNNKTNTDVSWTNNYLKLKLENVDKKLDLNPKNPSYYLEKAAVLIFENDWEQARSVLAQGLTKCSNKSELRSTLGNLNKVERTIASMDGSH